MKDIVLEVLKEHPDTQKPFINVNGKLIANPGDPERYPQKLEQTLKELREKELITSNPQSLIISDKSLKSELKVILTIEWMCKFMLFDWYTVIFQSQNKKWNHKNFGILATIMKLSRFLRKLE